MNKFLKAKTICIIAAFELAASNQRKKAAESLRGRRYKTGFHNPIN